MLFAAGDPTADGEIYRLYLKWGWWFDLFFMCVDRKTGNWLHFPYNRDVVRQGYTTMQILNYINGLWIEKINKEMEKITTR